MGWMGPRGGVGKKGMGEVVVKIGNFVKNENNFFEIERFYVFVCLVFFVCF